MKLLPEVAPEIRALLEEAVKDERSTMRLVPRHALLTWFDKGETVRAREVSTTSLEQHVIEAHREDLARMLYEASVIAYWKRGDRRHPRHGQDGSPVDLVEEEAAWGSRAVRRTVAPGPASGTIDLLRQCLEGVHSDSMHALASASLCLAPSDGARYCLAMALKEQPRTALAALERLANHVRDPDLLLQITLSKGARLCEVGRFADARDAYRATTTMDSGVIGTSYCFNLSCVMGEEHAARIESDNLGVLARPDDQRLVEAKDILRHWLRTTKPGIADTVRSVVRRLSSRVSQPASILCQAYES